MTLTERVEINWADRLQGVVHWLRGALPANLGSFRASASTPYGVKVHCRGLDLTQLFYLSGHYDPFLANELTAIETAFRFLDIGANQGLYTLLAAKNPHCEKAVALEPVPSTFESMAANLALNAVPEASATLLPYALSEKNGIAGITTTSWHSGGANLREPVSGATMGFSTSVQKIRTINGETLRQHIPGGAPLVLKIDVEGHEPAILTELSVSGLLDETRAVFCEVDTRWVDPVFIHQILESHGLTMHKKVGTGKHHYDLWATRPLNAE